MRRDLRKLLISRRELNRLTGVYLGQDQGVQPDFSVKGLVIALLAAFLLFFSSELLFENGIIAIILGVFPLYIFFDRLLNSTAFMESEETGFLLNSEHTHNLKALLDDVEKFNKVVKTLDVTDQLKEAGNRGMTGRDRAKAIEALKLAREDLIRALKTERILRENHNLLNDIITENDDLFLNNLSSLNALAIESQATEFGEILDNVLQIATNVKTEMRKLQGQK
ncbi:hypothetical protein PN462_03355 [Spirulina sp. CS-785/01]|uniref:hypothetical protein n=1 Tax=Spirulina sp. CS-785/01 TaxID=3021716 RepID=UPI002331585E|nr:hypothetical protein [Spirulina sp. CS-785/01]MDB9312126.1 hypothetical protein [Spirulina sp. CS-785/01]